jgi:hypothetical protein
MMLYRDQVEAAVRVVTILSPTRFAWFDQASPPLPRRTLRALDAEAARAFLVSQLRQRLYTSFYCTGSAVPGAAPSTRPARCPDFVHALSSANSGKGCWTAGWQVRAVEGDRIFAERDQIRLLAPAGSWREASGGAIHVGATVDLLTPKEQLGISPGHYLAQSDVELGTNRDRGIVRVYWNASAAGALLLMANLTSTLNDLGLFFRFKVIGHPDCFTRCDSAVLYFLEDDFERAGLAVARARAAAAREIDPAVPAFTKRLAPGVALAEDPTTAVSFGWQRCGLVAEAIVDAHERGIDAPERRLDRVRERFVEAGLSLEAPYLNPGNRDRYALVLSAEGPPAEARTSAESRAGNGPAGTERALELATLIGEQLARAALWHDGRCTWLGPDHGPVPCADTPNLNERRALGPSIYAGTSGVGLFLAELAAATKCNAIEAAAVGAARQALFRLRKHPASQNPGLYAGWPGVALAVARIGRLTGDASLVENARALVASNAPHAGHTREFNVMSGAAGAILALLSLAKSLGEGLCLDSAERLGNALCERAEHGPQGFSWRAPEQRRGNNLTGYSHGTAGVASALLELFAESRNERYLDAARQAFAYERHWFAPEQRNWPDFRSEHNLPQKRTVPPLFQTAWCHGAPGIALSRLRACVLLKDPACEAELDCALETTAQAIEHAVESGIAVASLCHGITGNVEILRYCCEALADRTGPRAASVRRGAAWIMDHAHKRLESREKPGHASDPGLMLGSAGLGLFLLRVARPATPSALWVS